MTDVTTLGLISQGLINIVKAVPGITAGFFPAPPNIETAQLPAAFVFTGSNTYDAASDISNMVRIFRLQVACIPISQGDPFTRETKIPPLIQTCAHAINAKRETHNIDWVETIRVVTDSGIVILPEYGMKFIGFELQVEVKYIERRT